MQLPFTVEQFFDVIRAYNTAVWPAQVVLLALALVAVVLVVMPQRWSGAGVSLILATFWAWLGLVYHLAFFTPINPLAYAFAAISVAAAAVFFWHGVILRQLESSVPGVALGSRSLYSRLSCIRLGLLSRGMAILRYPHSGCHVQLLFSR